MKRLTGIAMLLALATACGGPNLQGAWEAKCTLPQAPLIFPEGDQWTFNFTLELNDYSFNSDTSGWEGAEGPAEFASQAGHSSTGDATLTWCTDKTGCGYPDEPDFPQYEHQYGEIFLDEYGDNTRFDLRGVFEPSGTGKGECLFWDNLSTGGGSDGQFLTGEFTAKRTSKTARP